MKTPIQELLQELKSIATQSTCYDEIVSGVSLIVLNDNHWTEKEREVIERAYKQGVIDEYGDTIDLDTITEAEEYYNKTFNTKEK